MVLFELAVRDSGPWGSQASSMSRCVRCCRTIPLKASWIVLISCRRTSISTRSPQPCDSNTAAGPASSSRSPLLSALTSLDSLGKRGTEAGKEACIDVVPRACARLLGKHATEAKSEALVVYCQDVSSRCSSLMCFACPPSSNLIKKNVTTLPYAELQDEKPDMYPSRRKSQEAKDLRFACSAHQ